MKKQSRYCAKCGTSIPGDASYCHACGSPAPVNEVRGQRRGLVVGVVVSVLFVVACVGLSYMAYQAGLQSGFDSGYALGEKDGLKKGDESGYRRGYEKGYSSGSSPSVFGRSVDYTALAVTDGPMVAAGDDFSAKATSKGQWYLVKFKKNPDSGQKKLAPLVISAISTKPIRESSVSTAFRYWTWDW